MERDNHLLPTPILPSFMLGCKVICEVLLKSSELRYEHHYNTSFFLKLLVFSKLNSINYHRKCLKTDFKRKAKNTMSQCYSDTFHVIFQICSLDVFVSFLSHLSGITPLTWKSSLCKVFLKAFPSEPSFSSESSISFQITGPEPVLQTLDLSL